jgi:integrase
MPGEAPSASPFPKAKKKRSGTKAPRLPKLTKHSTGMARVRLAGRVHYCGRWGEPESYAKYSELLKQWLANGKQPLGPAPINAVQATVTVANVCNKYLQWIADTGRHVEKEGKPNGYRRLMGRTLESLRRCWGTVPVRKLSESLLQQWRDRLEIEHPNWVRRSLNARAGIVLRVLAWGRKQGMVPKSVLDDCRGLEPLKRGEAGSRPEHGRERRCVSDGDLAAAMAHCSPVVQSLMVLQLQTGARPGEIVMLRWADIDQNGPIAPDGSRLWLYEPEHHKTSHRGYKRTIILNQEAQRILLAQPKCLPSAWIFPSDNSSGHWWVKSYRRHVARACEAAGIQLFCVHELRHTSLSRVCEQKGVAAACAIAGHRSVGVTSRYVHTDLSQAVAAAVALGQRVS